MGTVERFEPYTLFDTAGEIYDICMGSVIDGVYVLHSDYEALEARHTALREAVAKMFESEDDIIEDAQVMPESYDSARAEVDRLLSEES